MTPDMVVGAPEFARSLLGSLGSGVVGIDEMGRIALLNEGARRILGCPAGRPEDALGRSCREVLAPHPTIARLLLETLDGRGSLSRAELILDRSDESPAATVGFTLCPVRDTRGQLRGAAMLLRDLTPFERADEQGRLRERLVALGEMAAGLAHEIRNPLAGMEVLAGLLRRRLASRIGERSVAHGLAQIEERSVAGEPTPTEELSAVGAQTVAGVGPVADERSAANGADLDQERALVDDLTDQIQRLARTVNASLDFVRPVDLARETLDPVEVVEGALQRAQLRASSCCAIERLYVDPLPRLVGDSNLLEVAVANLISNACEAMAGGDGRRVARLVVGLHGRSVERTTGSVRVGSDASPWRETPLWRDTPPWRDTAREEPELVISVSDTGPGIAPDLHERIFYPFFTTKQDGSGVGLSNVQKIVTGHGGAVVVDSRPGEGATFRIHLPGTLEST